MKVKIFGKNKETDLLFDKVNIILEELGLNDFIKVEKTTSLELQKELDIKKEPALIVEEESIDFTDTLFEGTVPDDEELKSMFISIIGGGDTGGGCDTSSCGSCGIC